MSDSFDVTRYNIANEPTPVFQQLSAHYKKSYAFYTMSVRIPVILTNIIDRLNREKDEIVEKYGNLSREELKQCIGEISKLKYEIQTNKQMTELPGNDSDQFEWNKLLNEIAPNDTYFTAVWLYAECYVYRKLRSIFEETQSLKDFDHFEQSKQLELSKSMDAISRVIKSVNEFNSVYRTASEVGEFFCKLLKQDLWGNRNDLSITLGEEIKSIDCNPLQEIEKYNNDLLIDQTQDIWKCISVEKEDKVVDIISDNSGFELLSDLVLCDFIIHHKLAKKIRFRVKAIPWFISDVLPKDFHYTLTELEKSQDPILKEAGLKWNGYVKSGQFELIEPADHFFTSGYEFYKMEKISPSLYQSIAESHLAIFKGDLNYRKLLGDVNWDPTNDFRTALNQFEPTNLCTLRTIKADLVCGLKAGQFEELWEKDERWMSTGQYGVIQFISKRTN
ncbi:damage-control phosphatase ARMT1-like [Chironomus tepperi]|uniref:damage-control phosphatase ARMT1-like n=1 Tax=Chironomus tepperi TaxID=113505 RepID=UPI00391FA528